MRTFFAIALSEQARRACAGAAAAFRREAPAWQSEKWVGVENLHVTLLFCGELHQDVIASVASGVADAIGARSPFAFELGDVSAVPSARRATMLWATLASGGEAAADLAAVVTEAVAPWGVQPSRRPFVPHITLVRARRPRSVPPEALAAASESLAASGHDRRVSVHEVILCSSTLTQRGPVYETISRLPLAGD